MHHPTGCQKEIGRTIRGEGGDHLLAVKGNQPGLHEAALAELAGLEHGAIEDGHGRQEERYTTVIYGPKGLPRGWPDVAAEVMVGRERAVKGKRADTAHHNITSLRGTAEQLGRLVRRHWSVGDEWHWWPNVGFREDGGRARRGEPRADPAGRRLAAGAGSRQG